MAQLSFLGFLLVAVILGSVQQYYRPEIENWIDDVGLFKGAVKNHGMDKCTKIMGPYGVEDMHIHHPSGTVIMAGGDIAARREWFPPTLHFNRSNDVKDPIFTYDLKTNKVQRLTVVNLPEDADLKLHGMDFVEDPKDSRLLYVFFINHRRTGSVVEIMQYRLGSDKIEWLETVKDEQHIYSPNDIAAVSRSEFYVTNFYHYYKEASIMRAVEGLARQAWSTVAFHHANGTMTFVDEHVPTANGIALNGEKTLLWVSANRAGRMYVYRRDPETNAIRKLDQVRVGMYPDNPSVDPTTGPARATDWDKTYDNPDPEAVSATKVVKITPAPINMRRVQEFPKDSPYVRQTERTRFIAQSYIDDDGHKFTHGTIAAISTKWNALLLGSIMGEGIWHCRL
ncbi:hypothetical protein BZG36_02995 [Bifiguratus adelaidae]|uniref:SMP-30/Gluconolactonase/LRE-like region domain-containing protein n=1 Tax=Bifiguratus adelaidae TaxID=1938954 RepID=A0A261XYG7_9FUNG|nr:hypothetical protein BZG36_02995 [Bifiguratus adelaidae]